MNQVKEFIEYIFNMFKIWVIVQPWQQGLRVRFGKRKKLIGAGIHFKIPYFDSVFVQETRLRVVNLPLQTITCKDLQTVTLNGAFGYVISNIEKLYSTLYHPETTLMNLTMAIVTDFISGNNFTDVKLEELEKAVLSKLQKLDYGIKFESFQIMNFASVKTYRLIQDKTWSFEGLNMDDKKQ